VTITPEPQKGNPMSDSKRVVIFDTTLRDGEQSPGISLDVGEKLEIAEQLARLGVDYLEAGFPVASQGDFEAVEAIARAVRGPVITGLSRTALKDVDRCWEAVQHAEKARIHVFIATSENHMKNKLKMTPEQVKIEAASAVAHARGHTDDVEFSPEDASRSDFDFMCEVLQIAVDNGATTLNIPDTVGFAIPQEFGRRIADIRERVNGDYVISAHCHDDLGMAVANSLAAVEAGARQVEVAMNGIGERAGNAALEEVVMALRTRSEYFGGLDTGVRAESWPRPVAWSAASPATPSSTTRPSSAGTPSPTRRASTSTGCWRTERPTRSWIPTPWARTRRWCWGSTPGVTPSAMRWRRWV
jgi:2-isopropylmalate synthase